MDKKRLVINLTAQLLSLFVYMGINIVLTPYYKSNIGETAYSYVQIANGFIMYVQILVSALNTMASRFITINIHQNNYDEANKYFTSVFYSNVIVSGFLIVPSLVFITFLDKIINIEPASLVGDVKLLFFFVFINYFITIITSIFSVATYATNRLDLLAVKTIQSELIRAALLVGAYVFLRPYLWYCGIVSVICTIYLSFANRRFTTQLLPDIKINRKYFDLKKIWELVSLGLWNSITRLGQVLLDQIDLLIANIFISPQAAAVIGYSKVLPTTISTLMGSVIGIFNPQITIAYAKEDTEELVQVIKSCNRMLIFILSIPLAFLTIYAKEFYRLWMPEENINVLYSLTILSVGTLYVSMSIQVLYHVFIITKKVKENSLVMLLSGVSTTLIVFILLKTTNLGIYAVAGVSTVIGLIRNLTFTPMYAAKSLGVKWYRFYSDIGLGFVSIGSIVILGMLSKQIIPIDSYFRLFLIGIPTGILAVILNYFIILTRNERVLIMDKVKQSLNKFRN